MKMVINQNKNVGAGYAYYLLKLIWSISIKVNIHFRKFVSLIFLSVRTEPLQPSFAKILRKKNNVKL